MNKTKTVFYTGASAIGALFCGLWASTQWAAYRFDYNQALHGRLIDFGDFSLYRPWEFFTWMRSYGQAYPSVFDEASWFLFLAAVVGAVVPFFLKKRASISVREFGKDAWGTLKDTKKAGLLENKGTVLGVMDGKLLTYDGPEHQLVSGASRSGKGVGHIVPSLLNWSQSAVIYDIKNELWGLTAGWRQIFSHTLYFNPTKPDSARFNPLLEIRKGPNEIRDTQNVVEILSNPTGKNEPDIWDKKATEFLVALVLHVLYSEEDDRKNLSVVRQKLMDFERTIHEMQTGRHIIDKRTGRPAAHPEVLRVANSLSDKADRFKQSVTGTAESYLTLFADEIIAENTSVSDFCIGDLMCADRPVSLYLQPPPSDAARLSPLIRLVISQISRSLMENIDTDSKGRKKKHKLLLLLDELPTLGKLEFLQVNMGQMAGYGLKAYLVVQSLNHIERAYGADNVIIDNCHIITAFASADTRTQERISKMVGTATEYRQSYNRPMNALSGGKVSVGESENVRPLMTAGDVRTLDQTKQLIFVTGHKPLKTDKLRYFEHESIRKRVDIDAPDQSEIVDIPGEAQSDWLGERVKGAGGPKFYERPKAKPYRPYTPPKKKHDFPDEDIEIDLSDFIDSPDAKDEDDDGGSDIAI